MPNATSTVPVRDPTGWVAQQYQPSALEGRRYYEPSSHGAEAALHRPLEPPATDD